MKGTWIIYGCPKALCPYLDTMQNELNYDFLVRTLTFIYYHALWPSMLHKKPNSICMLIVRF